MMQLLHGLVHGMALYSLALLLGVLLILLVSAVAPRFGVDLDAAMYAIPGVALALFGVLVAIYFRRRRRKRPAEIGTYELKGAPAEAPVADKAWRVVALFATIILVILAVDYGASAWKWLTSSEDLGMRLRRECETVVRETQPQYANNERLREIYVRQCIDARSRLVR